MSVERLSAEQLAALDAAGVMAYAKALQEEGRELAEASKLATQRIAEVQSRMTAEARQDTEAKLRAGLKFPVLGKDVLAAIASCGAHGATVSYDVLTGEGIFGLLFPAKSARKAAKAAKAGDAADDKAPARDLAGDYLANTTEAERVEDDERIKLRVSAAAARGSTYGGPGKADNSIGWAVRQARLAAKEVAGYGRKTKAA